jgi:ChrR Cupin-like domain
LASFAVPRPIADGPASQHLSGKTLDDASMELNADFSRRVAVHAAQLAWVASPIAGVDRRMLDRIGDEVARATSIVRYAPASSFSAHTHGGGEEFLVLDGVFQDEHGDYPAGSYVRNPPTSRHTPGSAPGCVLFVKLWQFDLDDRTPARRDARALVYAHAEDRPGVEIAPLFNDSREEVRMERWAPNTLVTLDLPDGGEFFVLDGTFDESGESFTTHSWLRLPPQGRLNATAGRDGCALWVKTGHLRHIQVPPRTGE